MHNTTGNPGNKSLSSDALNARCVCVCVCVCVCKLEGNVSRTSDPFLTRQKMQTKETLAPWLEVSRGSCMPQTWW
eukprot:COSAG05_NODE_688_length_7906_cov_24.548098_4_plen_75_part_00